MVWVGGCGGGGVGSGVGGGVVVGGHCVGGVGDGVGVDGIVGVVFLCRFGGVLIGVTVVVIVAAFGVDICWRCW